MKTSGCNYDEHKDKSSDDKGAGSKFDKQKLIGNLAQKREAAGENAKQLLSKVSMFIQHSSALKQLAVGAASGWVSGFVTNRVGKTAGLSLGGTILLIAAAEQTGIVVIHWDKITQNFQRLGGKADHFAQKQAPNIQYMRKYARTNTYFAAGFVGGFLLGFCT